MTLTVLGTGRARPAYTLTNERLSALVDTSDEWITSRTGIRSRQIVTGETLTELSVNASRAALEDAGLSADALDLIIAATIQGDYVTPSLANLVQRGLGASCPAFDLNAACSGFLYGLDAALAYIQAGKAKTVLILSAEQMSKHVDWTDRATCVLFGDGAAAAVAGAGDALKYLRVTSQGETDSLRIPARRAVPEGIPAFEMSADAQGAGAVYMNGQAVYKFAVTACTEGIRTAMDALGLEAEQVKYFLLHQANLRIIDAVRRSLGGAEEKFPVNMEHTGNMSSVSIPFLLDEMNRAGRLRTGDLLILSAFGAGLTSGVCVLEWRGAEA